MGGSLIDGCLLFQSLYGLDSSKSFLHGWSTTLPIHRLSNNDTTMAHQGQCVRQPLLDPNFAILIRTIAPAAAAAKTTMLEPKQRRLTIARLLDTGKDGHAGRQVGFGQGKGKVKEDAVDRSMSGGSIVIANRSNNHSLATESTALLSWTFP
jgi:hypothetical protein